MLINSQHFEIRDNRAFCLYPGCKTSYKKEKGGSTSNHVNHLKKAHKISAETSTTTSGPMDKFLRLNQVAPVTETNIRDLMIRWIVRDQMSFRVTESEDFSK